MNPLPPQRNLKAALIGALLAVALAAPAPALADATLSIAGGSTGVVGQPLLLHGNGTVPDLHYSYWFSAHVIPAAVMSACPATGSEAWQIAIATGGAYLTHAQRESADSAGNFTVPFGLTPWAPGDFMVCAYTDDGYTNTLARAQLNLHVGAAVAKPANTSKPRVKRSRRRLVCAPGRWSNAPTTFAYAWLVDGAERGDGRRLAVTRRLRGHKVRCRVTASNAGGATTALSRAVRVSRAPRHRSSSASAAW